MSASRIERLAGGWLGDSLLPIFLGLGATLAFAPFGYYPLLLVALIGLLVLWHGVSPRRAAWRGWLFGFAHNLSAIYWVFISIHNYGGANVLLAIFLTLMVPSYFAVYPALIGFCLTRYAGKNRVLVALLGFPAFWLLAEMLRGWVISGVTWLNPAYAFIDTPLKIFAPIVGACGLGVVIIFLAGALWLALCGGRRERWWAFFAVTLIALAVWCLPAPGSLTRESGAPIEVSLVQGNIPQDVKWRPESRKYTLQHYLDLTEPLWGRRLIIWPEVAIPTLRSYVTDYLQSLQDVAVAHGSTLLLGILVQDRVTDPLYNSVMELGRDSGIYYKRHLVPFGEYFPVPKFLLSFGSLLGLQYSDFSAGPLQQPPLMVGDDVLGMSICFEDAFGNEVRRALPQAGMLVNVTNDAWFADSLAPHQHFQVARMRALETGRVLLRATNTGISGVIGPTGEIIVTSPQFQSAVLNVTVTPRQGMTPYARYGDRPLWIAAVLLCAAACLISFLLRRRAAV